MDNSTISIRDAKPEDCDQIITLIQELANFANMPNGPKLSADVLRKDGFGEEKMFRCLVACDGDCLVAYALYFFNYSTWEGVNLYLEDLYVTPAYRHRGIGTKLWRKVAQVAVDRKCNRLDWEFADFGEAPNGPSITADTLRKDGFGEEKMFRCFVAADGNCLVAFALYFFNYSTWEGVYVYLNDLYVTPSYRKRGIGTQLMRKVAQVAIDRKCTRLDWLCLGGNEQAIEFYKSKGSVNLTTEEDWNLFRLSGDKLHAFANNV